MASHRHSSAMACAAHKQGWCMEQRGTLVSWHYGMRGAQALLGSKVSNPNSSREAAKSTPTPRRKIKDLIYYMYPFLGGFRGDSLEFIVKFAPFMLFKF
ncbi:hypothetical protein HAX54_022334, partial [Datura stramonium]|nr:hypothetical protein [Datura stramonium]